MSVSQNLVAIYFCQLSNERTSMNSFIKKSRRLLLVLTIRLRLVSVTGSCHLRLFLRLLKFGTVKSAQMVSPKLEFNLALIIIRIGVSTF